MIAKKNGSRHIQLQCTPFLQSSGFIPPNLGKRKYLDLYTINYLCVKLLIHIYPDQYEYHMKGPRRENLRHKPAKVKIKAKWKGVTEASVLEPTQRNNTYGHEVRRSIYKTRQTKHSQLPIRQ